MGDNDRRNLIITVVVCAALTLICLVGIHFARQGVYAGEIPKDDPEGEAAANEVPPEEWGEMRKIQEIKKQMDADKIEADKMLDRERQVIVFREIVARDAAVLPDVEDVNKFAETVRDFESAAGVLITNVSDLQLKVGGAVAPLPITLRLEGSFDEFLKFLNMFESFNRLINTRSFTLNAGEVFEDQGIKKAIHNINLSLVTYVYQAKAGNLNPVVIQDYDKKKGDAEIQKQIRQLKAPRLDSYQLPARPNRRDPFIEARIPRPVMDEGGEFEDREAQQKLFDEIWHALRILETDVKQYKELTDLGKPLQAATLKQTITEKISDLDADLLSGQKNITIPDIQAKLKSDVVPRFEKAKEEVEVTDRDLTVTRLQAAEFHTPMQNAFDREDYKQVLTIWKSFETFALGKDIASDAKPVTDKMNVLATRAQHHMDFQDLKLSWSAVIHVPRDAAKSRAIIDGKPRRVGDFVDDKNNCELKEIQQDALLFLFKGVEEIKLER